MPHSLPCWLARVVFLLSGLFLVMLPSDGWGQSEQPRTKKPSAGRKPSADPPAKAEQPDQSAAEQASDADEASLEEEKERIAAERFLSVLEKNPRRGTALDRVYGYHVERGSLSDWLQRYQDRVVKNAQDGNAWLLLGLIEAHRGQDVAAVKALQEAEKHLPESYLASFYLGQALVLVDQPKEATAAFERSIDRKPASADSLEIFQALGRVYQRTQQNDKALDVWNRLEKLFPNDLRVQEQIAQTLLEEDQFELALPRIEALAAKTTKDLYRRSQFQIQAAEIKVRLGKTEAALADFERLLGELNPENWMYRDVRLKIDNIFLRTEDQDGLTKYYTGWLTKHPDDIDAIVRLSRVLSAQDRMEESQQWLEKGLKLAPSRKDLRQAIIDQLVYDHEFAKAIKHYELLDQQQPNNPDTIREWGRLILRDFKRPEAERQQAASAIWKRLIATKPDDPVLVSQVADLFRHAGMKEDAIALYQQAIKLAPNEPQYREYLGEYFHQLKRPEEALKTWRQIIADKNRTAPNLARLAEVLTGFGYLAEGTATLTDAVALAPNDFDLHMKLARTLNRAEKYDASLEQLAKAEKLASNPEEAEAVLVLQLQNYQSAEKLPAHIERMQKELEAAKDAATAKQWYLLARYQEANSRHIAALLSIQRALKLDPKSIAILAASARLEEANNKFLEAAETNRKLALIDRRFRSEYLTKVAKLEARQGRKPEALQAGRDVITSAPGNPDSYEFFAQLCFQLGQHDEGLETLRRAVRVNPSDPKGVLSLASALANQYKTAEAIDLYWRAFERSNELDDKLDVISKLTELYLQSNHLDRLLERLDRARRADGQQQRVMTLCLAQAHQAAGDYGTARAELEKMLTPDSRDTQLIQQLAKLAELEGDFVEAAKYQSQLNKLVPSRDSEKQLARYLAMSGENAQANELLVKLALEEKDPERLLKSIDDLLNRAQNDQAILVLEQLVKNDPRNWEYLYRHGMALMTGYPQKAEQEFQRLLALNLPEGELGAYEQTRRKQSQPAKPASPNMGTQMVPNDLRLIRNSVVGQVIDRNEIVTIQGKVYYVNRRPGGGTSMTAAGSAWMPRDYREARIGAYARLLERAKAENRADEFVNSIATAWEQNPKSLRHGLDWFYLTRLNGDLPEALIASKSLLKLPEPTVEAQLAYLTALAHNAQGQEPADVIGRVRQGETRESANLMLTANELDELLKVYKRVAEHPEFEVAIGSGQLMNIPDLVMSQLRYANRQTEASEVLDALIAKCKSGSTLNSLLSTAAAAGRVDETLKLWDAIGQASSPIPGYPVSVFRDTYLTRLINVRLGAGAFPDVLKILDRRMASSHTQQAVVPVGAGPTNPPGASSTLRMLRNSVLNPVKGEQMTWATPIIGGQVDRYSSSMLSAVWVQCLGMNKTDELLIHFEKAASNKEASEEVRFSWSVALAQLQFFNAQHEAALNQLAEYSKAHPDDIDLKFLLAQFYVFASKHNLAINTLEGIQTTDMDIAQVREFLILETAMASNNPDRARRAAEVLSGMTMDQQLKQQVAVHMQRLGMTVPGRLLSGRVQRQAPRSQLAPLIVQLKQLTIQGNKDQALQLATSILQKTKSGRPSRPADPFGRVGNSAQNEELNQARRAAIQVLKDSGKLAELIERVELQLKNSPNSIQLHSTLAEYYSAAGEKEKAREMTYRLAELNQADPMPRWSMGLQLISGPDAERGMSMLRSALKQQPALLITNNGNEPTDVVNHFLQAKKLPELARLLDEVDLASLRTSTFVVTLMKRLADQNKTADDALPLLKRAWTAYPQERARMLTAIRDHQYLTQPTEVYEFAKQLIFPESEASKKYPNWWEITQRGAEGNIAGSLENLLKIARTQNKFDLLHLELSDALQKHPDWQGGQVAQAFLSIRRQQHEAPVRYFEKLIDEQKSELPSGAAWMIGQELVGVPKAEALAIRYYERAVDDPSSANRPFAGSPESSLVQLFDRAGKKVEARGALLKAAARNLAVEVTSQIDADRVVQNRYEIAMSMQKRGFVLDAVGVLNGLLQDTNTLMLAQAYGPQYSKEARTRLEAIYQGLAPAELATALQTMLDTPPKDEPKEGGQRPVIDTLVTVEVTAANSVSITSSLVKVLKASAAEEKVRDVIATRLQQLATNRPNDISVQMLSALLGLYDSRPEIQLQAAERIDQWLVAHPQQTADSATTPRRREQDLSYVALWLVARECLTKKPLQEIGGRVAERALLAGRGLAANGYLQSMLREWGLLAWDAGDKVTTEARWTELLDLQTKTVDPRQMMGAGRTARTATGTVVTLPPNPTAVLNPSVVRSTVRSAPVTMGQNTITYEAAAINGRLPADNCLDIARLAAERDFHALSFKALRQALNVTPSTEFAGVPPAANGPRQASSTDARDNGSRTKLGRAIGELHGLWLAHHAPEEEVYQTLLESVVPSQRPGFIQMYILPPSTRLSYDAEDIGHLLIRQAVQAKKVDDLREKLMARVGSTSGEYLARLLLVQIALEIRDIPDAKTQLAALSTVVQRRGLVLPSEFYSAAALPALEHDELALAAQPLLLQVAKSLMASSRGTNTDRYSRIYLRLSKLQFDRGAAEAGIRLLDQYLTDQDEFYKSFVGRYERSVRQRGLLRVARTLADAGQLNVALRRLGEATDMWQYDWTSNVQDAWNVVTVLRALQSEPADKRYEILKAWTLHTGEMGTIRVLDVFEPEERVPGQVGQEDSKAAPARLQSGDGTLSTLVLLIQAAHEASKLDDLLTAIQPYVERRIEHAGELRALIHIARQKSADSAIDLQALIVQAQARLNAPVPPAEPPWSAYHVACAAMSDDGLRPLGQQLCRLLIEQNKQVRRPQMLSHLRYFLSASLMKDYPAAKEAGGRQPGLRWWTATTEESAEQHAAGQTPPWWVAHADLVSHICGPDKQSLYFRYPLAGTFEFSVDVYSGESASGNIGFAGLLFNGVRDGAGLDVSPLGYSETLHVPSTVPYANNQYNRLTIQVAPNKVRYLVNQTLTYEDTDPGRNSPWLTLNADRAQQTVYRNFQLTGQPTIPRQVQLFEGDRLEGWVASFYQERQPPRRMNGRQSHEDAKVIVRREPNPLSYDWAADQGVLYGRSQASTAENRHAQSRLYYHRPLEEGDELTYEFHYIPGSSPHIVHPALDRMAMLLEPDGVRLHWITDSDYEEAPGLPASNATDHPEYRRGPAKLPFIVGNWNAVKIRLHESKAAVELNNHLIYEAPLDPSNSRQFGFYHDRTQSTATARNVILTGRWPDQLSPEVLGNLTALDARQPLTTADRHARHAIIGDAFYQLTVRDVWQQAAKLAPAERYAYLRDWVLPSDDFPVYRLIGDFNPVNSVPLRLKPLNGTGPTVAVEPVRGTIQFTGGDLMSPAYELVAVAKELQRLPELQQQIDSLPAGLAADPAAKAAMTALISIAREDWPSAERQLVLLHELQQQLPLDARVDRRWPAVLAGWQGVRQAKVQEVSKGLLEAAAAQAIRQSPSVTWSLTAHHLLHQANWLADQSEPATIRSTGPGMANWVPSAWAPAERRSAGIPPSGWRFKDGELQHLPGGTEDWLYFQSPLRGSFDVTCEISSGERQDLQLHYGARYVGIASNLREVDFGRIGGLMVSPQVGQPIRSQGQFFNYKVTVRDGTVEVFVDGHKILDRYQSAQFDSWLGIHAPALSTGRVRNFQITGSPTIPAELDLLANDRVEDAWRGDYYSHNGMRWREERGTLRSPKLPQELAPQQTLLQYHRPIAEDGELEYEYYYEPGAIDVHPALDRMVMLLNPGGVNVHWITDLQYDRTGLAPDNETTEPEHRRGPDILLLRPKDWNHVKLKFTGAKLTLSLNGMDFYERPLERTNQRTFGLFHYANQTEARIRNIKYRGNWPKSLPKVEDQLK